MSYSSTLSADNSLVAELDAAAVLLRRVRSGLLAKSLSDSDLLKVAASAAAVTRLCDAIQVGVVGEVGDRSRSALGPDRLSARKGCRSASELVQRITRVSSATA